MGASAGGWSGNRAGPEAGITGIPGVTVGCWTDAVGLTGCTVVLCPQGAVVAGEGRGGAPGTRETDLARPGTLVEQAQAVLLTGGSAYGLAAAQGVMRWLEERGHGFPVQGGRVPIVPGAVVFDLGVGDFRARPGEAQGYAACDAAAETVPVGRVGAGTGCTVAKGRGASGVQWGGQGTALTEVATDAGVFRVGALVVVNAVGDVYDPDTGSVFTSTRSSGAAPGGAEPMGATGATGATEAAEPASAARAARPGAPEGTFAENEVQAGPGVFNTTIGVVATDAPLSKEQAYRVAMMAHDGIALAIRPSHTLFDGDTLFVLATGTAPAATPARVAPAVVSAIGAAAQTVVARAIVQGVRA